MREMGQFLMKIVLVGVLVCFGIFYGVDLATHGISEVSGPYLSEDTAVPAAVNEVTDRSDETVTASSGHGVASVYEIETPVQDGTLVNVLADTAGTVLQRTARGGIELIVSLFDGILH